jgi:hypothetical protein
MSFIQELFTSRNNGTGSAEFVGQQSRIWWDPVTNAFYYSDGVTPGGIAIGGPPPTVFGDLFSETLFAIDGQTEFEMTHTPSGLVTVAINGATVTSACITNTGTQVVYQPLENGGYELLDGDELTFTYLYGTANASTLGDLGDVHISDPMNGSVLMYDGSMNLWVAGNPRGSPQLGIQNGTTSAKISNPDGPVSFTVAGQQDKVLVTTTGINLTNAGYRVNGNLAVNGPTLKMENRVTRNSFDSCDRPITVPYHQTIPRDNLTRVEYARLCWDTVSRFNPTANPITVAGIVIDPWSWRPLVPGYYQVTADITLEAITPLPPLPANSMVSKLFVATANQTTFTIDSVAQGSVIFVLNGATINKNAVTVTGTTVTYEPIDNGDYTMIDGDEVAIYYISSGSASGTTGWARLSLVVNGVQQVIGARYQMIADEYTATVSGILLVTPTDNISVSVIQTDSQPIQVAYSSLSASMIRGIE